MFSCEMGDPWAGSEVMVCCCWVVSRVLAYWEWDLVLMMYSWPVILTALFHLSLVWFSPEVDLWLQCLELLWKPCWNWSPCSIAPFGNISCHPRKRNNIGLSFQSPSNRNSDTHGGYWRFVSQEDLFTGAILNVVDASRRHSSRN